MVLGLGKIGLSPKTFWSLTWMEFSAIVEGYNQKEEEKWLHTRFTGALVLNASANRDPKKPLIQPRNLVPLSIDNVGIKENLSKDVALHRYLLLTGKIKPKNGRDREFIRLNRGRYNGSTKKAQTSSG